MAYTMPTRDLQSPLAQAIIKETGINPQHVRKVVITYEWANLASVEIFSYLNGDKDKLMSDEYFITLQKRIV